jgi:hypothetical protein
MLTKKELCQCILLKAQQKFNKSMTDLDVYYAGPEVGLALAVLGMIQDPSTMDYVKNMAHNAVLYRHGNGKNLTCLELVNLLPDENGFRVVEKEAKEVKKESYTWEQLKERLGDRTYYRLLDLMGDLKTHEEIQIAINALQNKLDAI